MVESSEDLLTSVVFGRLGYLRGNLGIELLLRAATPSHLDFIPTPGRILQSMGWPNLATDGLVEPDWVLHSEDYTLIVEAKWGRGNVPSEGQLSAQANAARAAFPRRKLVHVAVVQSGDVTFPPGVQGLCITWGQLRQEVLRVLSGDVDMPQRRILRDIRDALDRRGLDSTFLASLPAIAVRGSLQPWSPEVLASRQLPQLPAVQLDLEALVTPWN